MSASPPQSWLGCFEAPDTTNVCAYAVYAYVLKHKLCKSCLTDAVFLSHLSHSHCLYFQPACIDHNLQDCITDIAHTLLKQAMQCVADVTITQLEQLLLAYPDRS